MKYRIGSCYRCGLCCSKGIMRFKSNDGIHPYEFLGFSQKICNDYDSSTKSCKCHNFEKPEICREYPLNEECIPRELRIFCGYSFIDSDNYFGKIYSESL